MRGNAFEVENKYKIPNWLQSLLLLVLIIKLFLLSILYFVFTSFK